MSSFGLIVSESARHSNKKFKGKRIRDDLMFNKGEEEASRSLNIYRQVLKILDGMENDWTHDQKLVKKEKLRAEMEKGKRTGEFLGMVLRKCKLHDGPLTSINELEEFLIQSERSEWGRDDYKSCNSPSFRCCRKSW